ncbi:MULTISPECIES: hypothetical protein [unclassified Streptomyces]|uniref:hypothetical protein n=1 Tax=unclassified Streptomyces TaxID=2593676 RepID=UPI002E2FA33E|nr:MULTISPECIES: hypothetical protein [unclassified Streptomyces]
MLLPGTPPHRGRALDLPGAVLATAGITLASYGFVVTDGRPWSSAGVLAPLRGGAALVVAFWCVERRARDPLPPPGFLVDRRRALALTATALGACGTGMTFVVLSLHLQQDRAWSPLQTSVAFVPFAVTLVVSGRTAGPLIGRYEARAVAAAGLGTAPPSGSPSSRSPDSTRTRRTRTDCCPASSCCRLEPPPPSRRPMCPTDRADSRAAC